MRLRKKDPIDIFIMCVQGTALFSVLNVFYSSAVDEAVKYQFSELLHQVGTYFS